MPNYVPIISPRLTSILEANPELASGCDAELVAAATRHAGVANLSVSTGNDDLSRLDCVGIKSLIPHAGISTILENVGLVFPQAEQVFEAYLGNKKMLEQITERQANKEKLFLVYNHDGLITGAMGAALLAAALYEDGSNDINPGDIDLSIVLGTTTKRLNIVGVPVAEALVRQGIFQYVDFVVPLSYSTIQSPALHEFQAPFNNASMRAKVERNGSDPNNSIVETIHPSASTDKKITVNGITAYHLAPGGDSASLVSRRFSLPMGLGVKSTGEATIYMGDMQPPTKKREQKLEALDYMMTDIAKGMSKLHDIPSVYHPKKATYLSVLASCTTAV